MPNLTINTRRKFPAYKDCEIEAQNVYYRITQIVNFTTARYPDSSLLIVSGKMTELSDILAEIGLKSAQSCLTYQIVDFAARFLLTKWAIFYSIEVLETNTYKGLMVAALVNRNRGLNSLISVFVSSVQTLNIGGQGRPN